MTETALHQRYLLSVLIPFYRDRNGDVWLGRLWAHDLRAHLDYLTDLTVLAPEEQIDDPGPDLERIEVPAGVTLRFRRYGRAGGGATRALCGLPARALEAWRAVGQADLVHSGVAGWPLPPGLLLNPIAVLRRRPLIVVIESAFWRLPSPDTASRKARLRARLTEAFARWSLRRARLGIYTSEAYRDSLPVGPGGETLVLPASWISEALRALDTRGAAITVDVIGEGPMRAALTEFATAARTVQLRLLDPVEYGAPFMTLLQSYHAVIVPTTGDEQPRILFDAFSQAVPVVATATSGNREVLRDGVTGCLTPEGDAGALALALEAMAAEPDVLQQMGFAALSAARAYTHATMHQRRAAALVRIFGAGHKGLS